MMILILDTIPTEWVLHGPHVVCPWLWALSLSVSPSWPGMSVILVLTKYWKPTCWVRHWSPLNTATCKRRTQVHTLKGNISHSNKSDVVYFWRAGRSVKTSSCQSIKMLTLWGGVIALLRRCDFVCRRQPRAAISTLWSSCMLRGQSWASHCTHTYR